MQIQQRYGRIFQIGLTLAAGIVLIATAMKSQMPSVGPVWEYSSVTSGSNGRGGSGGTDTRATICYAGANGCRNEDVFASDRDGRAVGDAMMAAASELGEKGWELASSNDVFTDSNRRYRVMYFRRLKSVLNRSDSPGER
jgi:hypothetical protein